MQSVIASTTLGSRPPVNSAAIETPVTEPMVISTRLGGMVSVWAPVAARRATRSPGGRRAVSSRGTARVQPRPCRRALVPEMPETRYTWPRPEHNAGRRGRGQAGWLGTPPWRVPCRSFRSGQAQEYEQRHREQDEVAHAPRPSARPAPSPASAWSAPDSRRSRAQSRTQWERRQTRETPATPTKKMTRLRLPSGRNNGSASQNRPIAIRN